ncbi:hypothetical protein EYF80_017310 [Liparis tanakae]|uniref:Uncharacterized protein n=1 Tax=Liparis tanakae TaxID=230148 RepID=A0A4Z2I5F6_9TELE|nr:hypothetical protein EYF80_017310 [Liparis tanakae]
MYFGLIHFEKEEIPLRALLLPNTGQHPKESPVSRGNVLPYVQCGQHSGLESPHRGQHQTLPPFCPTASLADRPAKEQNKLMAPRQMCSGCDVGHKDGGERMNEKKMQECPLDQGFIENHGELARGKMQLCTHALVLGKPMDSNTSRVDPCLMVLGRLCRCLRGVTLA